MSSIIKFLGLPDDAFADLFVRGGDEGFKLHRVIVCPQSTKLKEICGNSGKTAGWVEYTLPEEYDADIFSKLVQFMYTGRYDDEEHQNYEEVRPRRIWHMSAEALNTALQPSGDAVATGYMFCVGSDEEDDADWDLDADGEIESEDEDEEEVDENDENEDEVECSNLKYESDGDDTIMAGGDEDGDDVLWREIAELAVDTPEHHNHVQLPNAMLTSVQVFTMADQFGIPALKLFAKERFYRSVERNLRSSDFTECIDNVYSYTGGTDLSLLKEIIMVFIYSLYEIKGEAEHLLPVIKKHAELSYNLLTYYVSAERLDRAREGRELVIR